MTKKKTSTRETVRGDKPKVTRQSAASAHEQEFAEAIMAPKFWELLVEHEFDLTYTTLTTCYNTAHGTRLSASSIKKYLDLLGWKYERKPTWTGLPELAADDGSTDVDNSTNTVDTAAILHGSDEDDEEADPTGQGHTIGGPLPGQGKLSPDERSLLG